MHRFYSVHILYIFTFFVAFSSLSSVVVPNSYTQRMLWCFSLFYSCNTPNLLKSQGPFLYIFQWDRPFPAPYSSELINFCPNGRLINQLKPESILRIYHSHNPWLLRRFCLSSHAPTLVTHHSLRHNIAHLGSLAQPRQP